MKEVTYGSKSILSAFIILGILIIPENVYAELTKKEIFLPIKIRQLIWQRSLSQITSCTNLITCSKVSEIKPGLLKFEGDGFNLKGRKDIVLYDNCLKVNLFS
jgi:hypothetical protein